MAKRLRITLVALGALAATSLTGAQLNLPPRAPGALTGSQFITLTSRLSLTDRENWIHSQVLAGNIPDFLRNLTPITHRETIGGASHTVTFHVLPDYLAIGSDSDYFLQPMTPLLAQRLCDALGATLPTRKMVNLIWTNAVLKLAPQPIPPSAEMTTVPVFAQHHALVRAQRDQATNTAPLGVLVAGDKKDVILSSRIYTNFARPAVTKPVVIYGWHYQSGAPIQPLYNGHEQTYADYSHGARLVQNSATLDGRPDTITNLLADPALAPLLSDDSAADSGSPGLILKPRYTIAPIAPVLLQQPRSQSILPGESARFEALATGDGDLGYVWSFSGAATATASGASLWVTNVPAGGAGACTVIVTNPVGSVTSRPALLRLQTNIHAVLWADPFETDTAADWRVFGAAGSGAPDYTVDWAYDHALAAYTFNGSSDLIPPAPHSPPGSTRALRLSVNNNDALAATAAVSLYPREFFSGNFALKFDLWINYPGNAGGAGAAGSTEHATFGINHSGERANWAGSTSGPSDGVWFAVDGEGGTTADYRAFAGNPSGPPEDLRISPANNTDPLFQSLFPASQFETAGAPGKRWVEVEIRQDKGAVSWWLDEARVAAWNNTSSFTTGTIMLGLMDLFPSIADPAADSFVLFDNARVEDLDNQFRILSASLAPNEQFRLAFSAIPGRAYVIESSSDWIDWAEAGILVASNAPGRWQSTPSHDTRFFRVKLLPSAP